LTMVNAEDYICVNGNFSVYSYEARSTLTNGVMEVKGNFTQRNYYSYIANNFAPSGNHKVILSGDKIQKVDFAAEQSYFNILEVNKDINKGYVFSRTPLWNELIESEADTEAPTAPKNLKFVRSNSSSVVIAWNPSSDNKEVYEYHIYRDGELAGSTKKTEYIDSGLKSHTSYEYYVIACDTSGNLSDWSNILEAQTDVDAYAPTQPANVSAKVQSEGVVRISWTASSDNGAVVKYNVYRNGILIGSSTGTAFTDTTAVGGYYEYYVEAIDNEGNASRTSASVFIDNLAPSAPVLTVNSVTDEYVSLSWESSDNVGVVNYELYRNNIKISSLKSPMYIDKNIAIDENYTYYVKAYDAAGNVSESSNEAVIYTGEDSEAPVINSIEYTGKPQLKNVVVTVSAADNCGISKVYIKYSTDKINWVDCGSESAFGKAAASVRFGVDTSGMPDGTVYLCAYAEDTNGNVSKIEDSPVYSFTVDNTAPEIPAGVVCKSENDAIKLMWNAGSDVSYYRIYRKTDGGEYSLVKDNHIYINYFESNIELGTVYSYAVTAVDEYGNESGFSEEVTGCISEDKTKPQVISVSPADRSKIGENPEISISCYDNFKLGDVTVQGKAENADEWSDLYYKELDTYAEVVSFTLDTSDIQTGNYQIKVSLTDSVLNKSEDHIVTYDYRECTLSAPALNADPIGWGAELSWTMTDVSELAGYTVYRKAPGERDFKVIGRTVGTSFTDEDAEAGKTHYYKVTADDVRGNTAESITASVIPTYEDSIYPTAVPGEGIFGIAGKDISFDGAASYDNHYIKSYHWDFGDGTASDQVKVKHSFETEGEYTVSLTVTDSAGNENTGSVIVKVYPKDYNCTKIRITDENGAPIANARIYCENTAEKVDAMSDSSGCYDFIYPNGSYDVYVYKNGYLPQMTVISSGSGQTETVSLKKQDVVTGNISVSELDFNDIKSLGIDINDPDNQNVYKYTVDLGFDVSYTVHETITVYVNEAGRMVWREKTNSTALKMNGNVYYYNDSGSHRQRQRRYYLTFIPASSYSYTTYNDYPAVYLAAMSVTAETAWTKQFFDVQLSVISNADDEFYIDNASAVINIPDGLSLADTQRGEKATVDMGVISSGKSKPASWIVRGDKAGSYNLSAQFSGKLMPFGEDITVDFETDEPLVVQDAENTLRIEFERIKDAKNHWNVQFKVTNISGRTLNNVKLNFSEISSEFLNVSDIYLIYPSDFREYIYWNCGNFNENEDTEEFLPALYGDDHYTDKRELRDGDSIVGQYYVEGFADDKYVNKVIYINK
ncbi:MAG: PKD domain-containing protein, partial [Ruminococcus sp.]|nr:PKD domain-containing protein [Ruminococcus sp.]